MQEVKNFFDQRNRLNKGYAKDSLRPESYYKFLNDNLPKPEILAQYEALHEGSTQKFLAFVTQEQAHRQQLEKDIIAKEHKAKSFGQICFLLSVAIISYFSFKIIDSNRFIEAIVFIISAFTTLIAALKFGTKKPNKNHK